MKNIEINKLYLSMKQNGSTFLLEYDWKVYYGGINFTVPKGFVTDFASVPKLLWWFVGPIGPHSFAAVLHDYMYSRGFNRQYADEVFYDMMVFNNTRKMKARMVYAMVRLFGWIAYPK